MKTLITARIEVDLTIEEAKNIALEYVWGQMLLITGWEEFPDDAGCDWYTKGNKVCISSDENWCVAEDNPKLARLVDVMNILTLGYPLHLKIDNDK